MVSVNYNGDEYYYLRNAQGDVVKLIDASGASVVEYTYDTWGKEVQTTGSLAGTLGSFQPFRYRGYVYDWETGLYYLQSRYYDPNTGRFLSADTYLSTGQGVMGHNAYAYCLGNPVNGSDPSGLWSIWGGGGNKENSEDGGGGQSGFSGWAYRLWKNPFNSAKNNTYKTQRAAMRAAKRSVNIPLSQSPTKTISVKIPAGENGQPYYTEVQVYGNKYIRNDYGGHSFHDGATMPRHYNAGPYDGSLRPPSNGMHFFY